MNTQYVIRGVYGKTIKLVSRSDNGTFRFVSNLDAATKFGSFELAESWFNQNFQYNISYHKYEIIDLESARVILTLES